KSDSEQLMILNKQKKGLLNFIKEGKKIQAYIDKLEKFGKSARECSSYLAETAYILNIAPSTQIGKLITAMKTAAYSKPDHPVYPEFHKKYHDILDMIVGSKSSFLPEYFSDLFQTNSELKPSEKVLAYVFFVLDSFYKQKARLSSSTGSNQDKLEDIRDLYLKVAKPTSNLKTLTQVVYESLVMMVETNGTPVSTKLRLYSSREGRVKWARYNEDIEFRNNEVAQQALTYLSMRTVQELYKNSPKNLQNMLQRLLKSIDVEANENDRLTLLDIFSRLPGNQELEILLKEFMENLLQYCCSCATSLFESYKKGKTPEDTYPLLMLAKYLCKNRELFSFQL
ncbi:MAG: hypothetical protein JWO53_254, partial [Chlamydiia bacterium]|nr:hypothetical protein [Chlamydiia bacterium]